ncbi:MAG: hypothetical protein KJO44_07185 [Gemmatimonadetes bacterium]|nr:hypothetical protein [Gemmatimonadota bacterium]MBT8479165.1 hypothetical protein [Gemmatimonadota bacterium]
MLLNQATLRGIEDGSITLAFRRWRRPTVKTGGTLLTSIGQLSVESVDEVALDAIAEWEAIAAGFSSLEALRSQLTARPAGEFYRVRLSMAGPDPRIALRQEIPSADEMEVLAGKLDRFDSRSVSGPWTARVLEVIRDHPGERAADLAVEVGMDRDPFKRNVRKLKALGLTESLEVGYRLSPRGRAVVERMNR